ncbi:MAG: FAD:protein transferase [Solirubrobacteraceae bacterium]|nr:FAD:protein transferase [Solirubrobacteraceae bacterium]
MSRPRETTRHFGCFGATVTVHVGGRSDGGIEAPLAAMLAEGRLLDLHRRLSRFDPASELSLLNADGGDVVHASRLLRRLARAVVQAGERSGGLVDATLVGALERAGYGASRAGLRGLAPAELAAAAGPPRPARAHPARAWERIVVDDEAGTIARPPGLRIDSGGLGKGLAADLLAERLAGHPLFAVDCGGDVRIGGRAEIARRVLVEDPAGAGAPLHELAIVDGAVATSGIGRRSWRDGRGAAAHHLLDPATGRPAWTGVVQATALAPTALEAEILAKAALLAGPARGRELLVHGGVLVLDGGCVDVVVVERPEARAA